jgi:ABC-type transport system involved in cytochrome bd biosynthesis fused ATPase/permease subunit
MNIHQHRIREARQITTVIALVCAAGFAAAVVPAVEQTISTALLAGCGLVLTVLIGRVVARVLRQRWEDRADTLAAEAWRARHAPHLLATTQDRGAV